MAEGGERGGMPSGKPVTTEQVEFIAANKEDKSPKQIARELGLDRATVVKHIKREPERQN